MHAPLQVVAGRPGDPGKELTWDATEHALEALVMLSDLPAGEGFISVGSFLNRIMMTSSNSVPALNQQQPLEPRTLAVEAPGSCRAVAAAPFGAAHSVSNETGGQDVPMPTRMRHPGGQP